MEIIDQISQSFIVNANGHPEILFQCEYGSYFITSHGAFNQREMYLEKLSKEEGDSLTLNWTNKILKAQTPKSDK